MSEFAQQRKALEISKEELQQRIQRIHEDFATGRDSDSQEQASERENDEALSAICDEAEKELAQVNRALSKFEQLSYGRCDACGESIEMGRLEAVPYATLCLTCAEETTHAH